MFSFDNIQGLPYSEVFYNCKVFGLKRMDEHVQLMTDQFTRGSDENQDKEKEVYFSVLPAKYWAIECII